MGVGEFAAELLEAGPDLCDLLIDRRELSLKLLRSAALSRFRGGTPQDFLVEILLLEQGGADPGAVLWTEDGRRELLQLLAAEFLGDPEGVLDDLVDRLARLNAELSQH